MQDSSSRLCSRQPLCQTPLLYGSCTNHDSQISLLPLLKLERSPIRSSRPYLQGPRTPGLACFGLKSESVRDVQQSDRPSRAGNTHHIPIQQVQSRSNAAAGAGRACGGGFGSGALASGDGRAQAATRSLGSEPRAL
eukprot:3773049-Pleurochrysis_carterae.AAC.2